jgi:chaperonin GroEL (HSP60 family)
MSSLAFAICGGAREAEVKEMKDCVEDALNVSIASVK